MKRGTFQAFLALFAAGCGALFVLRHEASPGVPPLTLRPAASASPAPPAAGGGPVHRQVLQLRRGDALEVVVEQRGSDVALRLRDPRGDTVLEADSPNGVRGRERLLAVAERTGTFTLEIALQPRAPLAGFRRRLVAVRPATAADRRSAAAELDFYAGELARKSPGRRRLPEAVERYRRALRAQLAMSDTAAAARSATRLGMVHQELGEYPQARAAYARALALGPDDLDDRLSAHNHLGALHYRLGAPEEAVRILQGSPALAAPGSETIYEAAAENNLALACQSLGRNGEAERRLLRARELWRGLGHACEEALTLANLGELHVDLGRSSSALAFFDQALALGCDQQQKLVPLMRARATAYERLGRRGLARQGYARALAVARAAGYPVEAALVLNSLGGLLLGDGQPAAALAAHREALALATASRDLRGQANALANLGYIQERLGRPRSALPLLARSLSLYSRLGEPGAEAAVLYATALAQRGLGRLGDARTSIEAAVAKLESLRQQVPAAGHRSSFLEARFDSYELAVDLLMGLHRRSPGAGFDVAAFEAVERIRARTLREALAAGRPARRLPEIQRELADEDTLLLAYFLGEERSFVWRVDRAGLVAHELPGRAEIEMLARRAHRQLAASSRPSAQGGEAGGALAELARRVLAPVASRGLPTRLLVVADGDLASVPFAALPDPAHPGEPLVARHEVVNAPSASVLAELRRKPAARTTPDRLVVVIADPVFGSEDPRLAPSARDAAPPAPAATTRAAEALGLEALERLPFSGVEAEHILALAGPGSGRRLTGFDANRQAVLAAPLGSYRIVHFATHAVAHADPRLSSVVLSLVDPRGTPRDGLLRAEELARLDLPAELIVLSACHTAAGTEVRGEGVLGLARAALRSGARRVLVSLWAADDAATAELMTVFYRGLLHRGLAPAAALREAQLALRRQPRWRAPAHWAGFVLQGEWRALSTP